QQWYDLCIAVNPTNQQEIVIGGQTQFQKSTNGGTSWTNVAGTSHVDYHDVVYASSTTLYITSDGGIYRSTTNGGNWANLNNNLAISQMYGFGQSSTTTNKFVSGWQDNDINNCNGTTWTTWNTGADGMLAFISRTNDNNVWGSTQNGALKRSTNGGNSFSGATTGITETGGWVTPWREDPVTANTLWAGFVNVWKSTNGGQSWTRPGTISGNTATMVAIAISPANNQVIWASTGSYLYKSVNGGTSWTTVTNLPFGYISYIACNSTDANKAWVTYSGFNAPAKVFQTNNQGTSWTDVASLSLPNIPVNCIANMNGSNDALYIGTDAGVYYKDATMNVWQPFTNGLPNVVVSQLEIFYAGSKIRASTYGRGMWESDFYVTGNNYSPSAYFAANQTISCPGAAVQFTDYSSGVPTSWSWSFPGGNPSTSTQQNPLITYNTPGTYPVTLTATNGVGADTRTINSLINISASTVNAPSASNVDFCAPNVVNLSATPAAPGTLRWWDAPGGGNLLATGPTYSPSLTATTSIYVDEDFPGGAVTDGVGELSNAVGGGSFFTANDIRGLYFDVMEPVTLNTVEVYSNTAANRTIEVIDAQGNTYVDTTVFIPATGSGTTVVTLNFSLYPGTGYFIKCRGFVDLYRNSDGASFPYTPNNTTNSIHITGTNAGSGGYYYFFYNWVYTTFVCNTARTQVVVTDTCAVISVNDIFGGNNGLYIYPNPSSGIFNLGFNSDNRDDLIISVTNSLGQNVYTEKLNSFTGKYEKAIDIRRH
ncbi:MAG: PKD domain-containing protein, partial [Bacteroidia bacterium]|nr:PKD domain-containing protein [Bacteroidia bacterium]